MTEALYGEIGELRTAIRRAINELDDADLGEGVSFNVRFIKRDLEKVLTRTLAERPVGNVGDCGK